MQTRRINTLSDLNINHIFQNGHWKTLKFSRHSNSPVERIQQKKWRLHHENDWKNCPGLVILTHDRLSLVTCFLTHWNVDFEAASPTCVSPIINQQCSFWSCLKLYRPQSYVSQGKSPWNSSAILDTMQKKMLASW